MRLLLAIYSGMVIQSKWVLAPFSFPEKQSVWMNRI
jgi:hypothetical protein